MNYNSSMEKLLLVYYFDTLILCYLDIFDTLSAYEEFNLIYSNNLTKLYSKHILEY